MIVESRTGGRCFISYRRLNGNDVATINDALHQRGVPTWLDTSHLQSEPTEDELRRVIRSASTSCALVYLTKAVLESATIRSIELPEILSRKRSDPSFFVVPVLGIDVDYTEVVDVVGRDFGVDELAIWNLMKLDGPMTPKSAAFVANAVLDRRLSILSKASPDPKVPLRLRLQARARPGFQPTFDLDLNWSNRFTPRCCATNIWDAELIPALEDVAAAIGRNLPDHHWIAEGLIGMPAALALGRAFATTRRIPLAWRQTRADRSDAIWSLANQEDPVDFVTTTTAREIRADDLALVVSITDDARPAFDRSAATMPPLRALLEIRRPHFDHELAPGQVARLVRIIVEELRAARQLYRVNGSVHVVIAGPIGLGVLLGQFLNTFPSVAVYEYSAQAAPPYVLATYLRCP